MKINKVKNVIMCAVLLFGMSIIAVPQARADASVLATYKLPFGLQFGKPIPEDSRFEFDDDDSWLVTPTGGERT